MIRIWLFYSMQSTRYPFCTQWGQLKSIRTCPMVCGFHPCSASVLITKDDPDLVILVNAQWGKLNIYQYGTDPDHRTVISAVRIASVRTKGCVLPVQIPDPDLLLLCNGIRIVAFKSSLGELVFIKLS
jgi:hypothetical protein